MKLADRLKMSLQRCMRETSSTEFLDWMAYLEMEPNFFHREDHYYASIVGWLQRALVKHPNQVDESKNIIKFKKVSIIEKQSKSSSAKSFFGRLLAAHKVVTKQKRH